MALAIHSGIPPAAWLAEDDRVLHTALDLVSDEREREARNGPQMSG